MDFIRLLTTLCIFSMMLLFVQCEKEEIFQKEAFHSPSDEAQNPNAKKPDNPGKPSPNPEWAVISGDLIGEGYVSTSVKEYLPFTLTFGGPFPANAHEGEIRILYSTKKRGEYRIDFMYTDLSDRLPKVLIMRKANPNDAYDPLSRTLTLDIIDCDDPENNCDSSYEFAIIAIRDGTGENFTNYAPAYVTVTFFDSQPEE